MVQHPICFGRMNIKHGANKISHDNHKTDVGINGGKGFETERGQKQNEKER
jgi:hypothetical protein